MPYIKPDQRARWRLLPTPETAGELNYAITKLCLNYWAIKPESYETYNAVIGVLESAKLEMYRRNVVPYEDEKIRENGDVY